MDDERALDFFEMLGEDMVVRVKRILEMKNKLATGSLIRSIDYAVGKDGSGEYFVQLLANPYWYWVNFGRAPGKFVPVDKLHDWMRIKGIDLKYSYPINNSIRINGIKGTFFLEESVIEIEREFESDIENYYGKKLDEELSNQFRSAFRGRNKK
jgi:hypothetical protein